MLHIEGQAQTSCLIPIYVLISSRWLSVALVGLKSSDSSPDVKALTVCVLMA